MAQVMPLTHLKAEKVRILKEVEISPCQGINMITGSNGSGKTSLLESIFLLGVGKSFRSRRIQEVINKQADSLLLTGRYSVDGQSETRVGLQRSCREHQIRINGQEKTRFTDLAKVKPIACITPDSHYEFFGGSKARRNTLDWALFHVEQKFLTIWREYYRVLRQRNALLRHPNVNRQELGTWTLKLAEHGARLQSMRAGFVGAWNTALDDITPLLVDHDTIRIELSQGWRSEHNLQDALDRNLESDINRGNTQTGPHRADLKISLNDHPASEFASQGQKKALMFTLRLAQIALVFKSAESAPILLIDDLTAELDEAHRERTLDALVNMGVQTFVSTVEAKGLGAEKWQNRREFHVEQGIVTERY